MLERSWHYLRTLQPPYLWLMVALVLCLVLIFSGCTTPPVKVTPPSRSKPAVCLQPVPTGLQPLPDNFTALDLDAQARALLLAHAADGKTYQSVRTYLLNCQQWIEAQP